MPEPATLCIQLTSWITQTCGRPSSCATSTTSARMMVLQNTIPKRAASSLRTSAMYESAVASMMCTFTPIASKSSDIGPGLGENSSNCWSPTSWTANNRYIMRHVAVCSFIPCEAHTK